MGRRLELQTLLETLLGSRSVYFQPPPNIQMHYPCIVYNRVSDRTIFSDNIPYNRTKRYSVTVIDRNPDGNISPKIGDLPLSTFDRSYASDDLNHDVYNLYF